MLSTCLDNVLSWPLLWGFRLAIAGVGLFSAASSLHPGEANHLARTLRPLVLVLGFPLLWLLMQAAPIPLAENPVWTSASGALSSPIWGHVTVDVGATILSMLALFLVAIIVFLVAALSIDRVHAEGVLIALAGASLIMPALGQISVLMGPALASLRRGAALDGLVLSSLMVLAYADLAFERHETRHAGQGSAQRRLLVIVAGCVLALAGCISVAAFFGGKLVFIANVAGILTFASLVASRRLGWAGWLTAAVLMAAFLAFLTLHLPDLHSADSIFLASGQSSDIERRMLQNVPTLGTGAGTAHSFGEIYRILGDTTPFQVSSIATELRIELGLPALIVIGVLLALLEFGLVRSALSRGRDSIYAILGASCMPALVALAFVNRGVFDWSVIVVSAGILGLALCQSVSRTVLR